MFTKSFHSTLHIYWTISVENHEISASTFFVNFELLAIMYYWDNHKRPHLKCWTPTGHLATLFFLKLFYASLKCKKGGFRVWKGVHFFKFKTKAYIYTFNMKVSVMEIHSIVMRNEEQNASCYISIDYCQDICWIVLV